MWKDVLMESASISFLIKIFVSFDFLWLQAQFKNNDIDYNYMKMWLFCTALYYML